MTIQEITINDTTVYIEPGADGYFAVGLSGRLAAWRTIEYPSLEAAIQSFEACVRLVQNHYKAMQS